MTKKLKVYLLIILAALCAACTVAGCKVGNADREELLAGYRGAHVTYYGNGGLFNKSTTVTVRDVYFASENQPFYEVPQNKKISSSEGGLDVDYSGFDLIGWYEAAVWEEGPHKGEPKFTYQYPAEEGGALVAVYPVPALDENGNPKTKQQDGRQVPVYLTDKDNDRPLFATQENMANESKYVTELQIRVEINESKPVTSARSLSGGELLVVCAKWEPTQKIVYKLLCDAAEGITDKDGAVYKNGDTVYEYDFGSKETASPMTSGPIDLPLEGSPYQFANNYLDGECTVNVNSDTVVERPEGGADLVIYSLYVDADWTVVRTSGDVARMFEKLNGAGDVYYVANDIDCTGDVIKFKSYSGSATSLNRMACTVEGNGHTIKGLAFNSTGKATGVQTAVGNGSTVSVFGALQGSATINDLTLKDVTVSFIAADRASVNLYALFASCASGASFSGFKVEGITATVENAYILNGGNYEQNWLFGGAASDSAFLATHAGVQVSGESLVEPTDQQ